MKKYQVCLQENIHKTRCKVRCLSSGGTPRAQLKNDVTKGKAVQRFLRGIFASTPLWSFGSFGLMFWLFSDPFRTIKHGCYDPIKQSLTVNARCLSDKHCKFLKNTECVASLLDPNLKTCR